MKKLISLFLCILLALSVAIAAADVDISGLSYEELVELVNKAQMEIMKSDKWQEVEVPEGTYLIGKDIPAGKWTISCSEKYYCDLEYGRSVKPNGNIDWVNDLDHYQHASLMGKSFSLYDEGDSTFVSWELEEGCYLQIKNGSAYFTPFKGNSFSFK